MKSIDEFATEYAQDKYLPVQTSQAVKAGANYVLEEIEKLTNNQNWCAFPKQSHKELKELIGQLKCPLNSQCADEDNTSFCEEYGLQSNYMHITKEIKL